MSLPPNAHMGNHGRFLVDRRQPGSYSEMGSEKFSNSVKSGYNKGTISADIRYLVVSKDVRRHRLISMNYISTPLCHGRGREFESRRPCHSFNHLQALIPTDQGMLGDDKRQTRILHAGFAA
jgi:hypothetical protein